MRKFSEVGLTGRTRSVLGSSKDEILETRVLEGHRKGGTNTYRPRMRNKSRVDSGGASSRGTGVVVCDSQEGYKETMK